MSTRFSISPSTWKWVSRSRSSFWQYGHFMRGYPTLCCKTGSGECASLPSGSPPCRKIHRKRGSIPESRINPSGWCATVGQAFKGWFQGLDEEEKTGVPPRAPTLPPGWFPKAGYEGDALEPGPAQNPSIPCFSSGIKSGGVTSLKFFNRQRKIFPHLGEFSGASAGRRKGNPSSIWVLAFAGSTAKEEPDSRSFTRHFSAKNLSASSSTSR